MSRFSKAVRQRLTQALALSERAVRALSAVAVGASTLLTESLFPEALRGTTIYQVTIGLMQRYILEQIAGMESEVVEGQVALGKDYAQRKMVGTALEAAGLLTVGFSPLWVFAIAGDAAGGSKVYLNRLVHNLLENHLIAAGTQVTGLTGLLDAVQQATGQSATAVDMPPVSREGLALMAGQIRASYAEAFVRTTNLVPQLDDIWEGMEQLASRENISMERLAGLMAVDAVARLQKGAGVVRVVGQTGAELLDEKILLSYKRTLAAISEQGVDGYVRDHMRPFMQAARSHLDSSGATWVERKLGQPTE